MLPPRRSAAARPTATATGRGWSAQDQQVEPGGPRLVAGCVPRGLPGAAELLLAPLELLLGEHAHVSVRAAETVRLAEEPGQADPSLGDRLQRVPAEPRRGERLADLPARGIGADRPGDLGKELPGEGALRGGPARA